MSPKAKREPAHEHPDRGLVGLASADSAEAVMWLFLSHETAIVTVAEKHGFDTTQQHWKKAEVAAERSREGRLPGGVAATLRLLNQARKVAANEGDEPDLEGRSLRDLAADVEVAVRTAKREASS